MLVAAAAAMVLPSVLLARQAQCASPSAAPAAARVAEPRSLSVQGQADVVTTPDEVTITTRVETFDRSLKVAKSENDRRVKLLLQLTAQHGVAAKDVQTSDFSITPRHEMIHDKRVLTGYDVHKRITLTLCDLDKAEALLGEVFEGGANALEQVSFQSSKLIEKRAEARLLAVQAARKKAEAMAGQLGQKLGHPLKVEEVNESFLHPRGVANYAFDNESAPSTGATLAAGKTRVHAMVSVQFELLDG